MHIHSDGVYSNQSTLAATEPKNLATDFYPLAASEQLAAEQTWRDNGDTSDAGNITDKLRRNAARRATTIDCSLLNGTIATQCRLRSVADIALPQGLCSISSQIVIPTGCAVNVSGTGGTIISGSRVTRYFRVTTDSSLNLRWLTLVNGFVRGDGVSVN